MCKYWLSALIILLNVAVVRAEPAQIVVVGLFEGHAVIQQNGQQIMLKAGQTTADGIKLISANSQQAVFSVNGVEEVYGLGTQISSDYAPAAAQPEVSLWPTDGLYLTTGSVNGYTVDFLVDTGASSVALNAKTAKRLGIDYFRGQPVGVKTASGTGVAYKVMLDMVQVGDIKQYNVEAVVLDGAEPARALLGMTFLQHLQIEHDGQRLDLKQKY